MDHADMSYRHGREEWALKVLVVSHGGIISLRFCQEEKGKPFCCPVAFYEKQDLPLGWKISPLCVTNTE